MKNRKVLNLRTHLGGLFGKTSYDADKDGAEMEITPVGVLVKSCKGKTFPPGGALLVPYPNCVEIIVSDEVETDDEDKKRGPGRPPKVVA